MASARVAPASLPTASSPDVSVRAFDFLPGVFTLTRGVPRDYAALASFHYTPTRPATWAGVWVVRYQGHDDGRWRIEDGAEPPAPSSILDPPSSSSRSASSPPRVVAVGVLSYPTPSCRARAAHFGLAGPRYGPSLRWANANLRTISRVIVHPQFRALGLATWLVRRMLDDCPTRYVEALATMARFVPLFERAGMGRVREEGGGGEGGGGGGRRRRRACGAAGLLRVRPPTGNIPFARQRRRLAEAATPCPRAMEDIA